MKRLDYCLKLCIHYLYLTSLYNYNMCKVFMHVIIKAWIAKIWQLFNYLSDNYLGVRDYITHSVSSVSAAVYVIISKFQTIFLLGNLSVEEIEKDTPQYFSLLCCERAYKVVISDRAACAFVLQFFAFPWNTKANLSISRFIFNIIMKSILKIK